MWAEPREISERCLRTPAGEIIGRHYPPPGVKGRKQLWKLMNIKAAKEARVPGKKSPATLATSRDVCL